VGRVPLGAAAQPASPLQRMFPACRLIGSSWLLASHHGSIRHMFDRYVASPTKKYSSGGREIIRKCQLRNYPKQLSHSTHEKRRHGALRLQVSHPDGPVRFAERRGRDIVI